MSAVVPSLPPEERMTTSSETLPIIELAAPMPGFPAHRRFALVRLDEEGLLYALTSADDPELRFLVAPPANLFPDYAPEIDDNTLHLLGNPTADQILTMVVITAGEEQTSANLLAPIIINQQNLKAAQVVLSGTGMPVRQLLTAGAA